MGSKAGRSAGFATRAASCLMGLAMAALCAVASAPAQAQANCVTTTRAFPGKAFQPGEDNFEVQVTVNSACSGAVYALGLREDLPDGWTFAGLKDTAENNPDWQTASPAPGGVVEFAWFPVPSFPFTFTYLVNVPDNENQARTIQGNTLFRVLDGTQLSSNSNSTVQLSVPPTITVIGGNMTLSCGEAFVDPGATALDPVDGDLTSAIQTSGTVNTNKAGDYVITYTVKNSFDKSDTKTRVVTVLDVDPPTLQLLGDTTMTIECGSAFVDPGATATDVCEGNIVPRVTGTVINTLPGTYTLSYVAQDAGGNASGVQRRTVIVRDSTAPTMALIGAASVTVECGSPYSELGATATDACDGDLTADIQINSSAVNTSVRGTYNVTYKVVDSTGNASVQLTRTVVVQDTKQPTITLLGQASMTIQCGTPYVDPGATAFDACKGVIPVEVDTSSLNTNNPGVQKVRYRARDGVTNTKVVERTINVVDFEAPTLTLVGNSTVELDCGTPYQELGATASDTCDKNLSVVVGGDTVNTSEPGSYRVTYTVQDASRNKKEASRLVVVRDKSAPVVTLLGDAEMIIECSEPYNEPGATVLDACEGDLSAAVIVGGDRVNISQPGVYRVTYKATDTVGNTSEELVRTVRVVDSKKPSLFVLEGSDTIACGGDYVDAGAIARDNCGGDITSAIAVSGTDFDATVPGSYTITYSVSDASGNNNTATRTVTVLDLGCAEEGELEGGVEGEGEGAELPVCEPESIRIIEPAANAIVPVGTTTTNVTLKSTVAFSADPPCDVPASTTVLYSIDGVLVGSSTDRSGGYPVTVNLGIGTYVLAATAVPQDKSKAVSAVQTFAVIVAVDTDANGILDNPFLNLPGEGDAWAARVATAEGCARAVVSKTFTPDSAGDVVVEVANPVNEDQKLVVSVKRGVLAEGEQGVLLVSIACNLQSLFDPYGADALENSLPAGPIAGQPFIDISIIASSDNGNTFRQLDTVEVDGAPAVSVDYKSSVLARGATFRAHDSIVDDGVAGLALQPAGGMWSRNGVANVVSTTGRLRAQLSHLSTLGVFVAVDLPAELTANLEVVNFGEVPNGETRDLNVTLMNGGDTALNATVSVSGDGFSLASAGNVNIPAGGSVVVTIHFDAANAGNLNGTLNVDAGADGQLSIPLNAAALQAGKNSATGCGAGSDAATSGAAADILLAMGVLGMLSVAAWRRRTN